MHAGPAPPGRPATSLAVSCGSGSQLSPAPRARLAPSSASAWPATIRSPCSSPESSAPQVPTRMARFTPSSASSWRTMATLGPPMPVDWMLRGRPSRVCPEYPPEPAGVIAHLRPGQQLLSQGRARPGSPGSRTSDAYGVLGLRWCGTARAYGRRTGVGCAHEAARAGEALRSAALGDRAHLRGHGGTAASTRDRAVDLLDEVAKRGREVRDQLGKIESSVRGRRNG